MISPGNPARHSDTRVATARPANCWGQQPGIGDTSSAGSCGHSGGTDHSLAIYQPVVNRLSHELGGPLALLRGYLSLWVDGSLDPAPWSTRNEVAAQFAVVDRLAGLLPVLTGSIGMARATLSGAELHGWVRHAEGEMARPIHELWAWFQSKDRSLVYELSFASAHAALVCERNAILLQSLATQLWTVQDLHHGEPIAPMEPLELPSWLRQSVRELAPALTCFVHTRAPHPPPGGPAVAGPPACLSTAPPPASD